MSDAWVIALGWLVAYLLVLGCLAAAALAGGSDMGFPVFLIFVVLGFIGWGGLVGYRESTCIQATKITEEEITLQGVADGFVRAAKDAIVTATKLQASSTR